VANKSTAVDLGNTSPSDDILRSAVKTYVDANSSISAITSKTTDYNVLSSDYTICVIAAGTFTLSLPDASSVGKKYVIRLTDVTDFALVITPALKLASALRFHP
jgi:hypothetical protein